MTTRIFDKEKTRRYGANRLLRVGAQVGDIDKIKKFKMEVGFSDEEFRKRHPGQSPIRQEFGREPIIIDGAKGYVVIYDGFSRFDRYNNMLANLISIGGCKNLETAVDWYGNSLYRTTERFKKFAEDLVDEIYSHGKSFDTLMVGPLRTAADALLAPKIRKNIKTDKKDWLSTLEKTAGSLQKQDSDACGIIRGTIDDYLRQTGTQHVALSNLLNSSKYFEEYSRLRDKLLDRHYNFFLNYQFIEPDTVGVNYVYGDQIFNFLVPFIERYVREGKDKRPLNVILYGKVGSLLASAKRGDIIVPNGVLAEDINGNITTQLFENKVAQKLPFGKLGFFVDKEYGATFHKGGLVHNVNLVLEQTVEQLRDAQEKGCSGVEMELSHALRALNYAKKHIKDLKVNLMVMHYVSDSPLKGDTLDTELVDYRGIYKALIIAHAMRQRG